MDTEKLRAVGQRLETAVSELSERTLSASELYELYEMVAIQMLDSEHSDFPPDILEAYLLGYLAGLPLSPK